MDKEQVAARITHLKKASADPPTESYIEFFISALPLFTLCNLFLQRSDPLTHLLFLLTKDLIQNIIKRFLKLNIILDLTMETLENKENYLPLSEVYIELKPKTISVDLQKGIKGETIIKSHHNNFLKACQTFFKPIFVYVMIKNSRSRRRGQILWLQGGKMVRYNIFHHKI